MKFNITTMIYFLDFKKQNFKGRKYDANAKPKEDVALSLANCSDVKSVIYTNYNGKVFFFRFLSNLRILIFVFVNFFTIRNETILIQYPYLIGCVKLIINYLKRNKNQIVVLVHDVESLRLNNGKLIDSEKQLFQSDILIVHTPQMATKIREAGFKGKFEILEFFDYYSMIRRTNYVSKKQKDIIFAGNLQKSKFISSLDKAITDDTINYFLYGKRNVVLSETKQVIYKGAFDAEDFSKVEGNWGLVWDGDSIDRCSGEYGEYLRVNAPFKFSLYLAMNIPVIVWSESAMAQYVKKYNLGICVSCLKDISSTIDALEEQEIDEIINGVSKASQEVRSGLKIKHVINKLQNL